MSDRQKVADPERADESPDPFATMRSVKAVRTTLIRSADGKAVDLSELPPAVRSQVEGVLTAGIASSSRDARGPDGPTGTFQMIQITGPDGQPRIYRSIDEIPAEDRRMLEELRKHEQSVLEGPIDSGPTKAARPGEPKVVFGATLDSAPDQTSTSLPWMLLGIGVGGLAVYYFMR